MKIKKYIQEIEVHLIQTHSRIFDWFKVCEKIRVYKPENGGWSINEILEHIALTSHFLFILIDKGSKKARKNLNNLSLEEQLNDFAYDLTKIDEIGIHKSFSWIRPEHMEPKSEKRLIDIQREMILQINKCLTQLDILKNGEGLLYKTTMTVNELGKINVYEYIYFLSKHAERHIKQMEQNMAEYKGKEKPTC